jgi:hypothetical protein
MKSLALYVDKWYIVGAYCGDGAPQPLRLPNGDDRIWLYFYNDREANRVSYSVKYKEKALAEAIDYYKDIFNLIPTSIGATYKRFGINVEIKSIFDAAGIFDDLRSDYQEDEKISTFISFSPDISYQSQSIFLTLLSEHGFEVQEFVAHIGHLALEYAYRHQLFTDCGYVFVANACNENLRFAIYEQTDGLFVCRKESLYEGLGIDLRKRAILQDVVENLDAASRFICNETERKEEYNYLGQYVDDWIRQIDADDTSSYMPIQLGNLHLKKQQGNFYPVSVMRSDIAKRTSVIIDDIVGAMLRMLTEYGIGTQNLTHIVFLGNSFENELFKIKLMKQTGLDASHIIHFREERLSDVVSVYAELNNSQFEGVRQEQEENLKKTIRSAQQSEENGDYAAAIRLYSDALDILALLAQNNVKNDERYQRISKTIANLDSKQKHFDEFIRKAEHYIDNKDWDEAIHQCQLAIDIMPKSEIATQMLTKTKGLRDCYAHLETFLNQINFFIRQGAYIEALEEVHKAESLKLNDPRVESIKAEIIEKQDAIKEQINEKKDKFKLAFKDKDFKRAISLSEELSKLDSSNQQYWAVKRAETITAQKKEEEKEKRYEQLLKEIEDAQWKEDWNKMVSLCKEAVNIKDEESVQNLLERAQNKINEQNAEIKEKVEKLNSNLQKKLKLFDYKAAIALCQQLAKIDKEKNEEWNEELRRLQNLQIEKSDLELNFRRKKADLNVIIRSGNKKEAERQIIAMRDKYWEYGIKTHDYDFQKLLESIYVTEPPKTEHPKKPEAKNKEKEVIKEKKAKNIEKPTHTMASDNVVADSEGYRLLKSKQYVKAKRHFAIEKNSEMAMVCTELIGLEKSMSNGTITKQDKARLLELHKKYDIS